MIFFSFLLVESTLGQSFTLEGDSSAIYLVQDEVSYTIYNEDAFSVVDSSNTPAFKLNETDTCEATFDRRLLIHGPLLASTTSKYQLYQYEQWKLVVLEDFQSQISDWSEDDISNCGGSSDLFLGGYCKFASESASKNFSLPSHSSIKISASFHFIDKWEGESAYLKLDNNYIWSESYTACNNLRTSTCQSIGVNVCGGDFPDRVGYHLSYSGPHNSSSAYLEFSSTLTRDSCEVSWGLDDLEIYIR